MIVFLDACALIYLVEAACALAVPGHRLFLTNDSGFKRVDTLSVVVLGEITTT